MSRYQVHGRPMLVDDDVEPGPTENPNAPGLPVVAAVVCAVLWGWILFDAAPKAWDADNRRADQAVQRTLEREAKGEGLAWGRR